MALHGQHQGKRREEKKNSHPDLNHPKDGISYTPRGASISIREQLRAMKPQIVSLPFVYCDTLHCCVNIFLSTLTRQPFLINKVTNVNGRIREGN